MQVNTFVFNPFEENTYLLADETKACVIIDPGCNTPGEKEKLAQFISGNGLKPELLLNTHGHVDHIMGNAFIKEKYNIPVLAHEQDIFLMKAAQKHAMVFGVDVENPPEVDKTIEDGQEIRFGNSSITVIHTPGHSPGGVVFYSREDGFAIAGDTLFNGSIGRTDLPGGDYNKLIGSIKEKLFVLDDKVTVYPGHGPKTSIENEKKFNPFLA